MPNEVRDLHFLAATQSIGKVSRNKCGSLACGSG
jgi:hypothetical protein